MFIPKKYVPILKWKYAEQGALKELNDDIKNSIVPLIEFVMPKPKSIDKDTENKKTLEELTQELILDFRKRRITKIPEEIMKSWGKNPIFIDFSLLYTSELRVESIEKILEKAEILNMHLIPVFNLIDDENIKKAIKNSFKKYNKGICLRIVSNDLEDINKLNENIEKTLRNLEAEKSDVDLLIDIKEINEDNDKYLRYLILSQKIKDLTKWKNFIFASGAFPETLSDCKLDEPNFIPRTDWQSWKNQLNNKLLKRNPIFADYAIRHPVYNETFQFYHPTTSIKYTSEDEWLILKGQRQQYEHYLVNAKLLLEELPNKFYGEKFCYGDRYIVEKAQYYDIYKENPKMKGTGDAKTWLRAGINHHLTLVVRQVANLS